MNREEAERELGGLLQLKKFYRSLKPKAPTS